MDAGEGCLDGGWGTWGQDLDSSSARLEDLACGRERVAERVVGGVVWGAHGVYGVLVWLAALLMEVGYKVNQRQIAQIPYV